MSYRRCHKNVNTGANDYHGLHTEDLEEFETLDFLDEMEADEELELMPEEEASLERSNEESFDSPMMDLREVEDGSLISTSEFEWTAPSQLLQNWQLASQSSSLLLLVCLSGGETVFFPRWFCSTLMIKMLLVLEVMVF